MAEHTHYDWCVYGNHMPHFIMDRQKDYHSAGPCVQMSGVNQASFLSKSSTMVTMHMHALHPLVSTCTCSAAAAMLQYAYLEAYTAAFLYEK